jgi:predicted lysophospholipase L1 biosynthesis ABC-type transport system permease subunit
MVSRLATLSVAACLVSGGVAPVAAQTWPERAIRSGTAEQARALLAGDIAKWSKLVKENNITVTQ